MPMITPARSVRSLTRSAGCTRELPSPLLIGPYRGTLTSRALLLSHGRQRRVDKDVQIEARPLLGVEHSDFVAVAEGDQGQVVADGDPLCLSPQLRPFCLVLRGTRLLAHQRHVPVD